MVDISQETSAETRERLRDVLARAELTRLEGRWRFAERPATEPVELDPRALALVRDAEVVSQLIPADAAGPEDELFAVFGFHFPAGVDNSGFVGWLASELKAALGTGVFVVCGSNRGRGGIYDYWGVPEQLGDRALGVFEALGTAPGAPARSAPRAR